MLRVVKVIRESLGSTQADTPFDWNTPVRFDPALVQRLVSQYGELDAGFVALVGRIHSTSEEIRSTVHAGTARLQQLRRSEALWLYPVITKALADDPIASRQVSQLRMVLNGLARRVLRHIEELASAAQHGTAVSGAATLVTTALAEYRRRNESELYPLYDLMRPQAAASGPQAA
jgi:hypothetical protein